MTSAEQEHAAIQELLGAFALDAVESEEADVVRAHLAGCPRCRAEVDAHLEVAAALGHRTDGSTDEVPEHLWDRISAGLASDWRSDGASLPEALRRQLQPVPAAGEPTTRRRWRAGAAIAAAVVIVVGALGFELGHLQQQVNQQSHSSPGIDGAVVAALSNPGHQVASIRSNDGRQVAQAVLSAGQGYLVADRLPALNPTRTYQLWGLIQSRPISLGLLGARPAEAAFTLGRARPSVLMITIEPRGGVISPTQAPIARGTPT